MHGSNFLLAPYPKGSCQYGATTSSSGAVVPHVGGARIQAVCGPLGHVEDGLTIHGGIPVDVHAAIAPVYSRFSIQPIVVRPAV